MFTLSFVVTNRQEILELMLAQETDDSDSNDSDDDLEMLLLTTLATKKDLGSHINFMDICQDDFTSLFR